MMSSCGALKGVIPPRGGDEATDCHMLYPVITLITLLISVLYEI